MPISERRCKEKVVCTDTGEGVLLSHKEGWKILVAGKWDRTGDHRVKRDSDP